jgi:hypothetical protein
MMTSTVRRDGGYMSKREASWRVVSAWVTAILTAGGLIDGLIINKVTAGWGWIAGAAALTLLLAALAGWLAYRNSPDPQPLDQSPDPKADGQAAGSTVVTGESTGGNIRTEINDYQAGNEPSQQLGPGAVRVDGKSRVGNIDTKVTGYRSGNETRH